MFRNWVFQNFPFLENDFDALTDYELFCKMMEYVKEFAKENEEFKKQLEDLENYIYNLDLQDEVNNKLDEMAENGQLQEIIATYLNLITNVVFKTVAEMKEALNLANGMYVKTMGFYEVGDGGASYYYIRNVTNEDSADEQFLIAVNNLNLIAEFVMLGKDLHSKQVGLKGDDTTDETLKLQNFFNYQNNWNINKIVDEGIYLINNTIKIKGRLEQAGQEGRTYQNGAYTIKFNNASIHCNNSSLEYCIKIYDFTEGIIDGLSLTRSTSGNCKILFIHCIRTHIKNFNIKQIEINSDPSLIDEELDGYMSYHLRFSNGYIRGRVIINPYNANTHYINGVYFEYANIHAFGYDSNIILVNDCSKQQITFTNCDISGSNVSVYDVTEAQLNPHDDDGLSSCHIVAINCYYDGDIFLFKNNEMNNISYSEFGTRHSGLPIENTSKTMKEYLTTTMLGVSSHNIKNILPITNLNLIVNGDMTSHTYTKDDSSYLFGTESNDTNKTYVASEYQKNGYVRQVTFKTTSDTYLDVDGRKFTYNAPAVAGLIFEFVTGGCDINLSISGKSGQTIYKNDIKNGINIFTVNHNNIIFDQESYSYIRLTFSNIEENTVLNVYEIGVQMGELYIPNAPLIKDAIPTN